MIKSVLFLFAVLAIASSLDVKLEKDFFFVGTNNKFKSTLYQTDTHVIVQSVEFPSNTQPVPQYLALDLTTGNATQILSEVSAACDPPSFIFDKLIYHDASSKLVYYCTNNNSILFIDKEDYHVTNYIDIGGSTIFNETRLIPDGDNLVILGIVDFFGQEATSTQFIRVNVGRRAILNNVSLGDSLKKPQTVVAFASSQVEEYVLATQTDGQNETISLYFMLWTGDSVKLVPVISTTYNTNGTTVIHNLYCYGSFVVTNTATDMIMVNQIGAVVYDYPNITQTKIFASPTNWAWQLSYSKQYGSQDLYLLFNNDTMEHLTISGRTVSSEAIGTASQMMVVIGSTQQDDLLFVIGDQGPLFSVIKAATQELVYQRPNGYRNLMITSSTYAAEYSPYLFIFNSTSDTLIANLTIGLYYYHDTDNGIVYFLNASNLSPKANCTLISIDLTKATYTNVYQFPDYTACTGKITAIDNTDPSSPQASILTANSSLLVITKSNGLLTFTPPSPTSGRNLLSYSLIDFKTFNLNYIYSQDYQTFTVELYTYDATNNSFSSGLSYDFQLSPFPISNIYTISGEELIAVSKGVFAYLNVSATKPTLFSNSYNRAQMSKFNDADGNTYTIFTEDPRYNLIRSIQPPSLFDFSTLNQLPETNTETTQGGAAGSCSFWTVDGMITSVGIVKYYSACSSRTEGIYA